MEMDMELESDYGLRYSTRHRDYLMSISGDRNLEGDAKRELEKEILLTSRSSRLEGKRRILRASDVLLSLAGRSTTSETREPSPAVENFQEVLRLFPPFREDDGTALGAIDVKCPDCDAIFSSEAELKQHYLTKYCTGAAVAVYVMTRDRLITKGYRMEKRLLPLDAHPIRFFCGYCERPFSLGDEVIERQRSTECLVNCTHCGSKCNVLYEPVLNDPRDDICHRDIGKELGSANHGRSPSLIQKSSMPSKFSMSDFNGEQSLAKRARKLRDSWTFRKLSQSDEEELLAISFAGLFDLERVHAPNGIYQSVPAGEMGLSDARFCSSGLGDSATEREKRDLCEDEGRHRTSDNSNGDLINGGNVAYEIPVTSKRQSFFQKLFGRKVPLGISRSRSTNKGKKLMKRANTIRFSFVTKYSRDSRATATARDSKLPEDDSQNHSSSTVQDAEYIALLRGTQDIFVHLQYLSGGAIVHDVSGRQRILHVDEVAKLFLQMKEELSSTAAWSRALTTRLRGEAMLKQGNPQAAIMEYQDAIKLLADTPGLDIEKQTRASILHSMGKAYQALDIAAEAEACYLESLGLYKRVLGRDHPKNFAVLHDLGSLCERDGYATEAAALYERSFAGRLKILGQNAPETLSSMQDLASLKVLLGDLESALMLLEKAVPALDTVFGIQHATTLNAMNKLSLLYHKLGLQKESRTITTRTIPHCRTVFGLTSQITRDALLRYLQSSKDNFDFPPDIQDVFDAYQSSRDVDCLRVIHRLGRSYMDAGLNRDAAHLFGTLVEEFLAVKGPEAAETFDALSALCVSCEHLDSVDKAMLAYRQLVHMAKRTPEGHQSRKRIGYAEKRIAELNRRRETLETEKREWGLTEPESCMGCGAITRVLCSTCNIARFCSDICAKQAPFHIHQCIASVTLRQSKSLAVKPKCPISARDQALSKINLASPSPNILSLNLAMGLSVKNVNVTASYTFYLDPRNFSTFRMKLNNNVNTVVLFSLDSDVEWTVLTTGCVPNSRGSTAAAAAAEQPRGRISFSRPTTSSRRNVSAAVNPSTIPSSQSHTHAYTTPTAQAQQLHIQQQEQGLTWLTPQTQDSLSHTPIQNPHFVTNKPTPISSPSSSNAPQPPNNNPEQYLLVKPGKEMLKSLVDKRARIRSPPSSLSSVGMGVGTAVPGTQAQAHPSKELIEYAQGLLLTGYLGEAFMYVVEWAWK
ncbi:hypothetical protein BDW74DRAFT_185318 [Aspergillus multicolor]|uniref:tetratricopeptide repeat protein n=1 Tax=Aspergillus multicolor TaxID=41759 RepID=UPI003CCD0352